MIYFQKSLPMRSEKSTWVRAERYFDTAHPSLRKCQYPRRFPGDYLDRPGTSLSNGQGDLPVGLPPGRQEICVPERSQRPHAFSGAGARDLGRLDAGAAIMNGWSCGGRSTPPGKTDTAAPKKFRACWRLKNPGRPFGDNRYLPEKPAALAPAVLETRRYLHRHLRISGLISIDEPFPVTAIWVKTSACLLWEKRGCLYEGHKPIFCQYGTIRRPNTSFQDSHLCSLQAIVSTSSLNTETTFASSFLNSQPPVLE